MVVVPAGSAVISRDGRGAPRQINLAAPLAVGRYDVTRDEFAAFVTATGYEADGCYTYDAGKKGSDALFHNEARANWRHVGFEQSGRDPVVCVNLSDAVAYTKWISQRTGHRYRLPSDEEWQYAARGGAASAYGWPANADAHDHANVGSASCCWPAAAGKDRWLFTSPVGSFDVNGFGLYDMLGNVEQWTDKCVNRSGVGSSDCTDRILRGGDWMTPAVDETVYSHGLSTVRESDIGFRVVRIL